jgi:hypothetical protein
MPKSSLTADAPEPVLLIIADIGGYTRYMTANAKTLAHSQTIITELVKAIIHQIELPLEVAKLEGDAVFLFCRKQNSSKSWPETKRVIGEKLLAFFRMFSQKVGELSRSTTCTCSACTHIDELRLKVVVHSGEALFHHVFSFLELAGVDVIIVHRLLKNSVTADQYLLLTEAARHDLEFASQIPLVSGSETYGEIGRINTLVYLPASLSTAAPAQTESSFATRFGASWDLFCKLWFSPFAPKNRLKHVTFDASVIGRMGLALLTILLTPIFPLLGLVSVFVHAVKPPPALHRHQEGHEHKPDGSCCGRL